MGNRKRPYFNFAIYHVTIRGNNKQEVLRKQEDKECFLGSLAKFKQRFGFKLFGYVIMNNHVHLMIRTDGRTTISKIMQAITLSYSVKFRKKYAYTGYVWQGRFRSTIIDDDKYVRACINYIHNNPVRAKLAKHPKDYVWSSYSFYHASKTRAKINEDIQIDRFSE